MPASMAPDATVVDGAPAYALDAQWGVSHGARAVPSPLAFPFTAQRTADGTCLVVDRRARANRILELARDGRVVWSWTSPPRVNFAHRLADGVVLLAHDNRLCALRPNGRVEVRAVLPAVPLNCGSVRDGVVALGGREGVFVLTLEGTLIRHVRSDFVEFGEAGDVELLADGRLLVTDPWATCVVELDPAGRRLRSFGSWRRQPTADFALVNPASACRLRDGRTVVADYRTGGLAEYDAEGRLERLLRPPGADALVQPVYVRQVGLERLLVADAGARNVTIRDLEGRVLETFGPPSGSRRTLSFPRTVQPLPGGELLVCDCFNDRIVRLGAAGDERWTVGGQARGDALGLRYPRSAIQGPGREIVVADGYNNRVLVLDRHGRVARELGSLVAEGGTLALADPHFACFADEHGSLLVVDSDLHRVLLVDRGGRVVCEWGAEEPLRDPHSVRLLRGGGVLIADSGHDRIVELERDGALRREVRVARTAEGDEQPLRGPRFADEVRGRLLLAEANTSRLLELDRTGRIVSTIGPELDVAAAPAATPELRMPKWAARDAHGRLLVSDFFNSRVVALRPRG